MKLSVSVKASFYLIVLIWAIFGVQQLFHLDFLRFGILPRTKQGLYGILLAPFLHLDLMHIAYNTVPLFVLSLILALLKPKGGIWIWLILAVSSGILTWLMARGNAIHVGSSGVIFALMGFIVSYGLFRRSFVSILISLIIVGLYGSLIWGILPSQPWISWEGHLFGLISGIFWGVIWGRADRKKHLAEQLAQMQGVK